ncbi:hypothetical protein ACFL20_09760 [Spirochaetota bacterium]
MPKIEKNIKSGSIEECLINDGYEELAGKEKKDSMERITSYRNTEPAIEHSKKENL